jgi:hypothetical protein
VLGWFFFSRTKGIKDFHSCLPLRVKVLHFQIHFHHAVGKQILWTEIECICD